MCLQNDQIDVALNSFLASKALANPSNKLSTEGRALVGDFREVVQQAKALLLSKNEGNLLQDFVWQTTQFNPQAISTPGAPINKETAQQHGNQALEGLRTLGTLIITNGQFRKLLNDATILLRDMAGDAAANTANKVRPDGDALNQIDRPAQDNTWHDAPNINKDSVKSQLQTFYKGNPKEDAKDAAAAGVNAAQPTTAGLDEQAGQQAAHGTAQERLHENTSEADRQQAAEVKEKGKETAAQYRERTKQYLSKKMPEERREQTIWRLKVCLYPFVTRLSSYC